MLAFAALAAVLLWAGGNLIWDSITHIGPGMLTYGSYGSDYLPDTDETQEVVPENQYKRELYVDGGFLIFVGAMFFWGVISAWKKRSELEKSWEPIISNPVKLQEIQKHPEIYRDDLKMWIKENHPNIKF